MTFPPSMNTLHCNVKWNTWCMLWVPIMKSKLSQQPHTASGNYGKFEY